MGVFTVSVHVMISSGPVLNIRMDLVTLTFCSSYFLFEVRKKTQRLLQHPFFHLSLSNTSIVTSVNVFVALFSTFTPGFVFSPECYYVVAF